MKVLLTRLEKDSVLTAEKLVNLGFQPIILPLSELRVLSPEVANKSPDFTLFTSANGVNSVSDEVVSTLKSLPAYAVGPKTAEALAKKAYTDIRVGEGDAKSLSKLILNDWSGKHFSALYFCGEERSLDFPAAFQTFGEVELCEVYRFVELAPGQDELEQAFESVVDGAILVYSAEGAKRIIRVFERNSKLNLLKDTVVIAISDKAAKAIRQINTKLVLIAKEPIEAQMLSILIRIQS